MSSAPGASKQITPLSSEQKQRGLHGEFHLPGDKSISHRAVFFGSLSSGVTRVANLLTGEDVRSTQRCFEQLGMRAKTGSDGIFEIHGAGDGSGALPEPKDAVFDCGNSGTTMRLLMGVLAGQKWRKEVTLTGDDSLTKRPMKRIADPLIQMGASITLTNSKTAPLKLLPQALHGIQYELKIASAQLKSALVLAGLFADSPTVLTGELDSRDHTERMLPQFGVHVETLKHPRQQITVRPGRKFQAPKEMITVPGDPSSGAFWAAAALLVPGSRITLKNMSLNPTRLGFFDALERMGAKIHKTPLTRSLCGTEPMGDVTISYAPLRGTHITAAEVPSLIDELPLLAVLALFAEGTTSVEGAEELRVKESDRIEAIAHNIRLLGGSIETFPDGFRVKGVQKLATTKPLESFHDHRIAMAFTIGSLGMSTPVEIMHPECVSISYPSFFETFHRLRGDVSGRR